MATLDWLQCPLVEVIPGKVSGVPLLKNTRLPVEAITGNYDAFLDEGLSPDAAIAETLDCYPEAGLETIKALLTYRAAHQLQHARLPQHGLEDDAVRRGLDIGLAALHAGGGGIIEGRKLE